MKKFTKYIKINSSGETLIEVIIALFLITGGIIATSMLANYSIHAGTETREKIQASLLAQEGIEVVKNIRDTNWINKVDWDNNLAIDEVNSAAYSSNFPNIGSLNGPVGGDFSNFTRRTIIEEVDPVNPDKKKVTCTVSWTDSRGSHNVPVVDYITNWKTNNQ